MLRPEIYERSPMRAFDDSLHGGLSAGELGAVVGPAGVGKSALLVHIALDRIMRDERVVHVSLHDTAEHVRSFYDEIFEGIARVVKMGMQDRVSLQVERHRLIHSYLNRSFGASDLESALEMMEELMDYQPACVLVDGYEAAEEEELERLKEIAREKNVAIWMALGHSRRLDPNDPILRSEAFSTAISLMPRALGIDLKALKIHGEWVEGLMGLALDPATLLVSGEDILDPISGVRVQSPEDCTLYSGGSRGTESFFGQLAEKHGMDEVNFTFPGHPQERTRGARLLSTRELSAGDVSLLYVSRRLNRRYREESLIRPVLQSIWHQVSWADQVFVVGQILEDKTVTGGTGWAVELARMWRKNLWVFDQAQGGWYRWVGGQWAPGVPIIESVRFCGTGTRELTESGQEAVRALFGRSFDQ